MNRKLLVTICALALGAFLWMGSSGGRAASANDGNTGAPGEGGLTCGTCHTGGAFGTLSETLSILDAAGSPITEYTPGETYTVTLSIGTSMGSPSGYGFQMTALDANNSDAGVWQNLGSNVQSAPAGNVGGRIYVEQGGGTSASNTFTMEWVAPSSSTGDVTFYFVGNAVNGDGGTSSDLGSTGSSLTLTEMVSSTQNPTAADWGVELFPNPVADVLNVTLGNPQANVYQASIVDLSGKVVRQQSVALEGNAIRLQAQDLPVGHYALRLEAEGDAAVVKFFKK